MATTRPFAYNTGSTIDGTIQVGNIAIGVSDQDYSQNPGGVKWWMGPDEELGYVIAHEVPTGDQPTPVEVDASIAFWRSTSLTDQSFLDLLNILPITIGLSLFTNVTDAQTWLSNNGHFTTYGSNLPTPTPTGTPIPTATPTPTPTPGAATSTPTPTLSAYQYGGYIVTQYSAANNACGQELVNGVTLWGPSPTFSVGDTIYTISNFSTKLIVSPLGYYVKVTDTNNDVYVLTTDSDGMITDLVLCSTLPTPTPTPTTLPATSTPTPVAATSTPTPTPTALPATNTPTPAPTGAPTDTPLPATSTPTPTPTTVGSCSGVPYNLTDNFAPPTSGNTLWISNGAPPTASNLVNTLAVSNPSYFNKFDNDGVDRTSYFNNFTNSSFTLTVCQNGNSAIYSGITGAIAYDNGVNSYTIDASKLSLVQSSPVSAFTYNELVYISVTSVNQPTATPVATGVPTSTPTPTGAPTDTPTPLPATSTPTPTPTPTPLPNVDFTIDPYIHPSILGVTGSSQSFIVNVLDEPIGGVTLDVSVRKDADNSTVYSNTINPFTSGGTVTITGLQSGVLCTTTIVVTSKLDGTNTRMKVFKIARQ